LVHLKISTPTNTTISQNPRKTSSGPKKAAKTVNKLKRNISWLVMTGLPADSDCNYSSGMANINSHQGKIFSGKDCKSEETTRCEQVQRRNCTKPRGRKLDKPRQGARGSEETGLYTATSHTVTKEDCFSTSGFK